MYLVLPRATLWGREIRPKCEVSTLQLLSTFEVPQAAAALLDRFLAADEVLLIEALDSAEFSVQDAVVALEAATREPWPVQRVDELLRSAYRRGVLELVDDTFTCYRLGTFYGRLSVFVVSQPDTYLALPAETRSALARAIPFAAWGLAAYAVLRPGLGAMAVPVAVYVTVVCLMMWRAAARVSGSAPLAPWLGLAGALAFAASDTLIAFDRFHAAIPGAAWPIMILYWLGQWGIAASTMTWPTLESSVAASRPGQE